MGKIVAFLVVIVLLIWGAFAAGLIRFSDSEPVETVAQDIPMPTDPLAAAEDLPQPMFASDDAQYQRAADQPEERPVMQAQVVLDRLGFSPGVIDGEQGPSFEDAVRGFQIANDIEQTGMLDDETKQALARWNRIPSTREIRLTPEFVDPATLVEEIPEEPEQRARLERLTYTSVEEKLAERFHTTPDVLAELNPDALDYEAGSTIIVPNIGKDQITSNGSTDRNWLETLAMLGVANEQVEADHIVVDKSDGVLQVFDGDDRLIAQFPATMGSEHDPLPLGDWDITGVSTNPRFDYNPALFWDVDDSEEGVTMPPGPNSPVGVVWIDLSKEHYGIHGTAEPTSIGRAQSHGCVRLTNWDAARLAQMVSAGTKVHFQA